MSVRAFADETTTAAAGETGGLTSLLPFVLMIAVFGLLAYFMIIRPDKKRRKEAEDVRASLKVGDNVTTIGGIIGTITSISGDTFTLDNGLKFRKTAIYTVDDKDIDLDDDDDDEDEEAEEKSEEKK
ncbi:MAG: preprotein translocase subunit YajC [Clostridia bacterium]|nr:preprotein translocase subunit YajC [Clostridia bacterium]